jgi:hypothetical protein
MQMRSSVRSDLITKINLLNVLWISSRGKWTFLDAAVRLSVGLKWAWCSEPYKMFILIWCSFSEDLSQIIANQTTKGRIESRAFLNINGVTHQ